MFGAEHTKKKRTRVTKHYFKATEKCEILCQCEKNNAIFMLIILVLLAAK